ncbi:MAG TPA: nucleotide sugar dehydrogenase [Nitrososphaeraceae archaeon]
MGTSKISIIGSGVVGTATGRGFDKLGHEVIFYDVAKEKLRSLKNLGYNVANTLEEAMSHTEISFICVNTPTSNAQQDLSQVMSALYQLANFLNATKRFHLIVFRSTMLPGTMRDLVVSYLDMHCSRKRGVDYQLCYNPEFLRQNSALDDFFSPDRVIIGEDRKGVSENLVSLYKELTDRIIVTTFEAAELIKYASNCFLALKISFFNEIGMICRNIGIDDKIVSLGVSLDKRIGKYGTEAGRPFDGMCLPKDTQALASYVKKFQIEPDLLQVVLDINKRLEDLTTTKQLVSGIRESFQV